ncbi:MAG: hypothetical protein V4692_10010 [Bdellovibrionota bacterium]
MSQLHRLLLLGSIGSILLIATACTKKVETTSLRFSLPASVGQSKVTTFSFSSCAGNWGGCAPTAVSDLNCYLVTVDVPEMGGRRTCTDLSTNTVMTATIFSDSVQSGGQIEIVGIPPGKNRTINLVGLVAQDAAACASISRGSDPIKERLSAPHVVAKTLTSLVPGDNSISLIPSLTGAGVIEECSGNSGSNTPPPSAEGDLLIRPASTFYFGPVPTGEYKSATIEILNNGLTNATSMMGARTGTDFTFPGGSYPGTGGTCGAALAPAATCTVVVKFTSISGGIGTGSFSMMWDNGATSGLTTSIGLQATGIVPWISITSPAENALITSGNASTFTVSGKCSHPGRPITLSPSGSSTCTANGDWTASINMSGQLLGNVLTTATITDSLASSANGTRTFIKDH